MTLRKHATSLAIMHAAEILQPLLILPYAGRVLGPLYFGQFAYAVSIGQLAATIVEFGFYWTAQRAAASARHEPAVIAALLAEVAAAKAILCVAVTIVGLASANALLDLTKPMFLYTMLTALGGILFPAWLFIGLERAWQAAFAVVIARILALICFLALVTSPAQLELAVAIQSAIPVVSAVISLPFVISIGFGGFRSMTLSAIGWQFRNSWRAFLFALVERVLVTLPVPLVQHFSGYVAAGQYAVAEKFVAATRPFLRVVSDTFLPRVAYYAHHDREGGIALIWRSLSTLVVGAALSLGLLFVAPYVILIFFGDEFSGAIPIVRIMSVIPILLNINIVTSNLYMFNYGHERAWAALTVSGLIVFLAIAFALSPHVSNAAFAVAVAIIAREVLVLVVSAGFFFAFGATKVGIPTARGDGSQTDAMIANSALTSLARSARPARD
jgi:O-antigen/teichoic acid export membrane protein